MTGDITVAFGPKSNDLYASILKMPVQGQDTELVVCRTDDAQSSNAMDVLEDRTGTDQPFIQTVANGASTEAVFIGNNDFNLRPGKTSTVDYSLNAAKATAIFKNAGLESRNGASQNGPQVRAACHSSGVTYVAYYGWRNTSGNFQANTLVVTADVVVARDDSGATGASPFTDLTDSSDGKSGQRVATNVKFPFRFNGKTQEGQQRLGGDLAIAVDPNDSKIVYLGYSGLVGKRYTLHVLRSTDSGQTWSADVLTVPFGINVGLTVNADGDPGLLYQQLTGSGSNTKWETHFRTASGGDPTSWNDLVLSTHPASSPAKQFDPYLGDYAYLTSQGQDYYGVFSASNEPDLSHFPNGVEYQRVHDFASQTLSNLGGAPVPISIDPFFFKFTP
jgi:hypothetical protein